MTHAYQSFIDLGIWHLAESTLFALLIFGLAPTLRLQRASSRFAFYQLAILKFIIPLGALTSLYLQPGFLETQAISELATFTASASSKLIASNVANNWIWTASAIWALGFLLLATTRSIGFYRSRLLGSHAQSEFSAISNRIKTALSSAGYSKSAELPVHTDARISSIGLVGFFRPRIIINAGFLKPYPAKNCCPQSGMS